MKFRPCIDLHEGKVKQIVGKTLDNDNNHLKVNFISEKNPAWFADLYKNDNLFGGHVIMLGPGNSQAAKEALNTFQGGLQIGGGINDINAKEYLDAGASHIIVTSYVFKDALINWDNLKKINKIIGKEKLVLDLSCKFKNNDYYIVTDKWQKLTDTVINQKNISLLEKYCSEFLIHAVDVEGMMTGIDLKLIDLLSKIISIPATYAGGITGLTDLDLIKEKGNNKIDFTIGSALDIFGGKLAYKEVVNWHKKNNEL